MGVVLAGETRELDPWRGTEREWLGDEVRPVDEVALGRDQLDLDALAGKVVKREQRLGGGDTSAGDQDSQRTPSPPERMPSARASIRARYWGVSVPATDAGAMRRA